MNPNEYIELLLSRQQQAIEKHDWPTKNKDGYEFQEHMKKAVFPLEAMIRPEDAEIFTPPKESEPS